jgi:dihydroorotate dehydrogenase (NAD+) catalytic subunit
MARDLLVTIGQLKLKNPVMVASGTFGYAEEFKDFIDLKSLGAIVTKTITFSPRAGNPPARTCETPAGMLNSVGLQNPGLEVFIKEKLPVLKKIGVPVIVSIAAEHDLEEFVHIAKRLEKLREVGAIELNISCPNIANSQSGKQRPQCRGGAQLVAQDARATYALVEKVRSVTGKTLITKLTPNVTCISDVALAAQKAGSDAVSLINTLGGMSIDVEARKPKLASVAGGLSGPAIRPVAVKMVWETYQRINIPIIGMGGIIDASSALEFFIAGATAVSVGTANFMNPRASIEILAGIRRYLRVHRISQIKTLIGSLQL